MSLSAIQDNLIKTSLVQQTQSRSDGVVRGQEIAQVASQREHDRQEDQVVIHARETENQGVRTDEEKEQQKRREKEEKERKDDESPDAEERDDTPDGPRARMRRINIVI